jgi:Putative prokaryotic signal transducing protein
MPSIMEDKIIVYSTYETAIKANLAKTKLDAYGIPCFLSDEHLAGVLPLNYFLMGQVRLHIFEMDADRVREVLEEENLTL